MEQNSQNRRDFLRSAVMGATVLAAGQTFRVLGATESTKTPLNIFVCGKCGHVEFGAAPDVCPVCHAPKGAFSQNNNLFIDSEAKNRDLAAGHVPAIIIYKNQGLIPEQPNKEVSVRIGKKLHPMEAAHHILFIDCYNNDKYVSRMICTPGIFAAGNFFIKSPGSKVRFVEMCNVHGYWQAESEM